MSSIYDPNIHEGKHYVCCDSDYAVDGNKSTTWVNGRQDFLCAHTDSILNQHEWWAVDLQRVYSIENIHLFGRTDCCQISLANFEVDVIWPTCSCNQWTNLEEGKVYNCHYQAAETQIINITCPPNTRGRFVRIRRGDTLGLGICEIEIYGNPINSFLESGVPGSNTAYACGNTGYEYLGPIIGTSVAYSRIQCTSNCITDSRCSAAEYDKTKNVCTLKSQCINGNQSSLVPNINKDVFFMQ
ncbi:Hypothetical predicted protein [Mytilus galloprovincialis]|uniref:Fucolectin tachylectin-4 pentraxin-1 domain-containing protein n=1 Tax=Mytilus galloprovincialis TaxID=29158 RepID=A0A8B6FMG3_MYTGA|nr:Hypothetical predicted protein [Mytilus galloprovincialis]